MRMSALDGSADPRPERAGRRRHRGQQRPRAGHRARAGARRGDRGAHRARRGQGGVGARGRSSPACPRGGARPADPRPRQPRLGARVRRRRCAPTTRGSTSWSTTPGVMMPPAVGDRRRVRASVRHQPPRPLRAHRAAARRARRRRGLAGGHRLAASSTGPGRLDFDDLQSERGYSPRGRLPAVEVRQRGLRARARPPPARRRPAGDQRPRPPRLLGDQPAEHAGRPGVMKAVLAVGNRLLAQSADAGRAAAALRGDRARGRGRPVLRPRRLPARRAARRPRSQPVEPGPRRARPGQRLWEVSEELTGVSYLDPEPVSRATSTPAWAGSGCRRRSPSSPPRDWDAIVVGGGPQRAHRRGLPRARGQAGAGLERREQLGGAARSSARSPTSASWSAPARTWSGCSTRW